MKNNTKQNNNSHSREHVLQSIRHNLGKTTPTTNDEMQNSASTLTAPAIDFSIMDIAQGQTILELFKKSAIDNQCSFSTIATEKEIPATISTYLQEHQLNTNFWGWQQFAHLNWSEHNLSLSTKKIDRNMPVENTSGLTGVSYAIADTGSLLIQSHPEHPLETSLLPENHIAVVHEHQICQQLTQVLDNALINNPQHAQTVLISGPSRTADIEQTLVLGAHGPKRVHIILIKTITPSH